MIKLEGDISLETGDMVICSLTKQTLDVVESPKMQCLELIKRFGLENIPNNCKVKIELRLIVK